MRHRPGGTGRSRPGYSPFFSNTVGVRSRPFGLAGALHGQSLELRRGCDDEVRHRHAVMREYVPLPGENWEWPVRAVERRAERTRSWRGANWDMNVAVAIVLAHIALAVVTANERPHR